jgi:hypothetical protein
MRQGETFKQSEDHPLFETLQTSPKLLTTTITLLHILFESTSPKRIARFKQSVHAAIWSNTWQAGIKFAHTCYYPTDSCLNLCCFVIINTLVLPLHQAKTLQPLFQWRHAPFSSMPSTMPFSSHSSFPSLSGPHHHVSWLAHTASSTLESSLGEDEHASAWNATRPQGPRRAQTMPGHAQTRAECTRARHRTVASVLPYSSNSASSTTTYPDSP